MGKRQGKGFKRGGKGKEGRRRHATGPGRAPVMAQERQKKPVACTAVDGDDAVVA